LKGKQKEKAKLLAPLVSTINKGRQANMNKQNIGNGREMLEQSSLTLKGTGVLEAFVDFSTSPSTSEHQAFAWSLADE
jgi:hypothetical protein